jgi:hypothetical protein
MATLKATDVEYIGANADGGMVLGFSASEKVGFYGKAPVVQRAAAAAQATSAVGTASSADVTTGLKAAVIEIMNTLTAVGLWAGST